MNTIDCSTDLRLYDDKVQTCGFLPSSGSDVHNYWYSPFHDDGTGVGHSGAYKLPLAADGTPHPTQISRTAFSTTPPTVACDDPAARSRPMCIKVDPGDSNKLAPASGTAVRPGDFSDGVVRDTATDCADDGMRWIPGPTAFAPSDPQGRTTYEVRGCALDCIEPDFGVPGTGTNMEPLPGGNKSSGDDFSVKFKCVDGYGPPTVVSPASLYSADRELMVSAGMDATKCAVEGGPYALNYRDGNGQQSMTAPHCVQDCTLPSNTNDYPGYDLANTGTNLSGINISPALLDSGVVSRHLICADGYTLRDQNFGSGPYDYPVSACGTPGGPIVINDETAQANLGGCIADCIPSSQPPLHWQPEGTLITTPTTHDFHTSGARYLWQDPTSAQTEALQLSTSSDPAATLIFSCPSGYEVGPGSDVSGAPTYESCGNLPGYVNSLSANSIATRSTYGLTGCYPICSEDAELCYNYKTERSFDLIFPPLAGGEEEAWRNQMGQMLTDATSSESTQLSESNISFVRRQVLNNGADMNMGKEILEWQIKCPKSECTNDPTEIGKININDILGQDGIPNLVTVEYTPQPGVLCTDADGQTSSAVASIGSVLNDITETQAMVQCNDNEECVGFTFKEGTGTQAPSQVWLKSIIEGDGFPLAGYSCYSKPV